MIPHRSGWRRHGWMQSLIRLCVILLFYKRFFAVAEDNRFLTFTWGPGGISRTSCPHFHGRVAAQSASEPSPNIGNRGCTRDSTWRRKLCTESSMGWQPMTTPAPIPQMPRHELKRLGKCRDGYCRKGTIDGTAENRGTGLPNPRTAATAPRNSTDIPTFQLQVMDGTAHLGYDGHQYYDNLPTFPFQERAHVPLPSGFLCRLLSFA